MENIDIKTLIYFLIAIVWFIFSVFRKSKKETEKPDHAPSSESNKEEDQVDVKTLLEEILTGKKNREKEREKEIFTKEVPVPDYEKKEKKKKRTKPFYTNTSIIPSSISTPKKIPTTSSFQTENKRIFELENETLQQEQDFLSDFDSEKAIIYSEIMKRPHY